MNLLTFKMKVQGQNDLTPISHSLNCSVRLPFRVLSTTLLFLQCKSSGLSSSRSTISCETVLLRVMAIVQQTDVKFSPETAFLCTNDHT